MHSSVTILKRQESIEKEIAKKLEEYEKSDEIKDILELMKIQHVMINYLPFFLFLFYNLIVINLIPVSVCQRERKGKIVFF